MVLNVYWIQQKKITVEHTRTLEQGGKKYRKGFTLFSLQKIAIYRTHPYQLSTDKAEWNTISLQKLCLLSNFGVSMLPPTAVSAWASSRQFFGPNAKSLRFLQHSQNMTQSSLASSGLPSWTHSSAPTGFQQHLGVYGGAACPSANGPRSSAALSLSPLPIAFPCTSLAGNKLTVVVAPGMHVCPFTVLGTCSS